MIVVEIRPSLRLATIVVAMHIAAAFSLAYTPSIIFVAIGAAAVLTSLLAFFWRYFRQGTLALGLEDGGTLILLPDVEGGRRWCVMPGTTVSSFAIWLFWRDGETGRRGTVMVLPDQVSSRVWRTLQVWVRLKGARLPVAVEVAAFPENASY